MMHKIHLYGHLQEEFGPTFDFDVATAGEAFRALNCAFPKRFIAELKKGSYRVVRGDVEVGMDIDLNYINAFKLGNAELHVIPVASGSKGSSATGTLKLIGGTALIGAAIFFSGGTLLAPLGEMGATAFSVGGFGVTYGNIAMIGLAAALLGASTMLSKAQINNDNTSSFTFSGPINVNNQGAAVPLIFGEVICGSQAASAGFDIETIPEN